MRQLAWEVIKVKQGKVPCEGRHCVPGTREHLGGRERGGKGNALNNSLHPWVPLTLRKAWLECIMKFCCHSLWPWFVTSSSGLRALFVKGDYVELGFYEVIFIGSSGLLSELGLRSGDRGHTLGRWCAGVGGSLTCSPDHVSPGPLFPEAGRCWGAGSRLLYSGEVWSWWSGRVFLPVVQLALALACKVLGPLPGAPALGRRWQLWIDILSPPT